MKRFALAFALLLGFTAAAAAQVTNAATTNGSVKITTGLTYQVIQAAVNTSSTSGSVRHSLTIENNNTNGDVCYLFIGGTQITAGTTTASTSITVGGVSMTAAQASILLAGGGGSFARYFPYVPSDAIYGTCASAGDSLYVDTQ